MHKWTAVLVALLTLPTVGTSPALAGTTIHDGTFVARAMPFPQMNADVYYPDKGSCLDGIEGLHKVSEPFHAPAFGTLHVSVEGLSGDWDLYVLGRGGGQIKSSTQAQVIDGAAGEERISERLRPGERVQMVACNWLGEPEITVHFNFASRR